MRRFFSRSLAVLIAVVTIVMSLAVYPADTEAATTDYDIYKVTTSANLRESPSMSGKWIMVVPAGKYVAFIDEGENSYYHVKYGEYEGYIYVYCVNKDTSKSFDDYIAQFPGLESEYDDHGTNGISHITGIAGVQNAVDLTRNPE